MERLLPSENTKADTASRSDKINELLADYPFIVKEDVRWGDMDAMGHVNNTIYFRYFEDVRVPMLRQMQLFATDSAQPAPKIGPILAATDCRFKIPLTFPDTLHLGCRVSEVSEDRFIMTVRVVSEQYQRVAAEGKSEMVVYDYEAGKKAPMPAWLTANILKLQPELTPMMGGAGL